MRTQHDPVDVALGAAIRRYRIAAGMSLEELGREVGVTYQQVQKYETGANRVAFSTLLKIGRALPGAGAASLLATVERSAVADGSETLSVDTLRLAVRLEALPEPMRTNLVRGFGNIADDVVKGLA